jgi:hypothetical protein
MNDHDKALVLEVTRKGGRFLSLEYVNVLRHAMGEQRLTGTEYERAYLLATELGRERINAMHDEAANYWVKL